MSIQKQEGKLPFEEKLDKNQNYQNLVGGFVTAVYKSLNMPSQGEQQAHLGLRRESLTAPDYSHIRHPGMD